MAPEEKKCPCDSLINAKKDIKDHGSKIHEGDVAMAEIKVKLENIEKRFDKFEDKIDIQFKELTDKLQCIELKPAKRWDALVGAGIGSVVGAIVSAVVMIFTTAG